MPETSEDVTLLAKGAIEHVLNHPAGPQHVEQGAVAYLFFSGSYCGKSLEEARLLDNEVRRLLEEYEDGEGAMAEPEEPEGTLGPDWFVFYNALDREMSVRIAGVCENVSATIADYRLASRETNVRHCEAGMYNAALLAHHLSAVGKVRELAEGDKPFDHPAIFGRGKRGVERTLPDALEGYDESEWLDVIRGGLLDNMTPLTP